MVTAEFRGTARHRESLRRVIILGAAGHDFHSFNVVYREDPENYCHSRHRYGAGPYRGAGNSGSLEEDNRDDHKTAEFLREIAGRATLQTHQIRPVLTRPRI